MKNIIVKLTAIGMATALAATSLAINTQPAKAGDEFWGSVLGGFLGGVISSSNNGGRREGVSSKKVKKAARQMLLNYGLAPIDECTANVVLVSIGEDIICAVPNHTYGPGTYRVHPDTLRLEPYGMTAKINNGSGYQPQPNNFPSQPNNGSGYQPQPNNFPSQPNNGSGYQPQPNNFPVVNIGNSNQPSSPLSSNGSIYRLSGQQISPPVLARLRSLLAGNNIAEAACGATAQQVIVTVNNDFVICGHPNNRYTPGNYSFTLNGIY